MGDSESVLDAEPENRGGGGGGESPKMPFLNLKVAFHF